MYFLGKTRALVNVAFTAVLSKNTQLSRNNEIVVYDKVFTNVGKSYDPAKGTFTVRTAGIYGISVSMMGASRRGGHVEFVKNGDELVTLYSGASGYDVAPHTLNLALSNRDRLRVRRYTANYIHNVEV